MVRLNKAGSKKMSHNSTTCAGIDVAKEKLDIAVLGDGTVESVANDRGGWRRAADRLRAAGVGRVGLEASGGYERDVATFLRKQGFEVRLLQPAQVRAFAGVRLRRAKNDSIDAKLIAACTAVFDGHAEAPNERLVPCADRLTFIEQIEEDIARAKTRLEHIREPRLRRMVMQDITRLKARAKAELARIANTLRADDELGHRFELVLSVPGIGERTAVAIMVRMPEIGRLSREEAAALAGLAPFDDDSGTRRGQRHIAGGRARLRRSLYAAALAAAFRWNQALIALYRRLTDAGKPHKAALVACARKLIVYANTVVQRGTPWSAEPKRT